MEKRQVALNGSRLDENVRKAKGDDGRYTSETLLRRARDAHQPAVRCPRGKIIPRGRPSVLNRQATRYSTPRHRVPSPCRDC